MKVSSGFWGDNYKPIGVRNLSRSLRRRLMKTRDGRKFSAQVLALTGHTVGSEDVSYTRFEVPAVAGQPNTGIVDFDSVTVDRPSTAQDVADVLEATQPLPRVNFPRELSGNSGGGKLGY